MAVSICTFVKETGTLLSICRPDGLKSKGTKADGQQEKHLKAHFVVLDGSGVNYQPVTALFTRPQRCAAAARRTGCTWGIESSAASDRSDP